MQDFGHETVGIVQYIIVNLTASIIFVTGSDSSITRHTIRYHAELKYRKHRGKKILLSLTDWVHLVL